MKSSARVGDRVGAELLHFPTLYLTNHSAPVFHSEIVVQRFH